MSISLLVASPDERFRESIRENLTAIPNARVAAEYAETGSSLYIRVLQDLERSPDAALVLDVSSDPDSGLKALERVKLAAPGLYVVVSDYESGADRVIACLRAGANDYMHQPIRRAEFRDAMARLERAPKRVAAAASRLGRIYSFLGAKGGVGTTTLAVNFAAALAQRSQSTVLMDLDFTANDCAAQVAINAANSLQEIGDNLGRLDQALFEGLTSRDASGFLLTGPRDEAENRTQFNEPMFRELASFLVEKYDNVVVDAGRWISDEVVAAALQSSTSVFLVLTQEFAAIRNAQRYVAGLMRIGFTQDQVKIVVNRARKQPDSNIATIDQIKTTLNMPVLASIPSSSVAPAAINKGRPFAGDKSELDKSFRSFVDKATGVKAAAAK